MFEKFMIFISGLSNESAPKTGNADQLAAAALMFAVMDADGVRHESEKQALRESLRHAYQLDDSQLSQLETDADAAEAASIDFFQFTSSIVKLEEDKRLELISLLWEVVFADGELHEMEDNVVWRISELIGVSQRDRVEARRRAAAAMAVKDLPETI